MNEGFFFLLLVKSCKCSETITQKRQGAIYFLCQAMTWGRFLFYSTQQQGNEDTRGHGTGRQNNMGDTANNVTRVGCHGNKKHQGDEDKRRAIERQDNNEIMYVITYIQTDTDTNDRIRQGQ